METGASKPLQENSSLSEATRVTQKKTRKCNKKKQTRESSVATSSTSPDSIRAEKKLQVPITEKVTSLSFENHKKKSSPGSKCIVTSINKASTKSKHDTPIEDIVAQLDLECKKKQQKKKRKGTQQEGAKETQESQINGGDAEALVTQGKMADFLVDHGELNEALTLYSDFILKKEEEIYGLNHEATIKTQLCIASILVNLEKWQEAGVLYKEIGSKLELTLGTDNEQTIDAQHDYAKMLHQTNKIPDAIAVYRELCERGKRVLSPSHEKTLEIQFNLACALQTDKLFNEAYDLFHNVFEKRAKILGENHAYTIECQSRKAQIFADKEKYTKSIKLYESIIRTCSSSFGNEHPITIKEKIKLISTLLRCGKAEDALKLTASITTSGSKLSLLKLTEGEGMSTLSLPTIDTYSRSIDISKPVLKKVGGTVAPVEGRH